jgi:hypothetical protein
MGNSSDWGPYEAAYGMGAQWRQFERNMVDIEAESHARWNLGGRDTAFWMGDPIKGSAEDLAAMMERILPQPEIMKLQDINMEAINEQMREIQHQESAEKMATLCPFLSVHPDSGSGPWVNTGIMAKGVSPVRRWQDGRIYNPIEDYKPIEIPKIQPIQFDNLPDYAKKMFAKMFE